MKYALLFGAVAAFVLGLKTRAIAAKAKEESQALKASALVEANKLEAEAKAEVEKVESKL